jgi:hypothetical protein
MGWPRSSIAADIPHAAELAAQRRQRAAEVQRVLESIADSERKDVLNNALRKIDAKLKVIWSAASMEIEE